MDIKSILGRLNEEQHKDASALSGIRRTIAGPGTGKTGTQVAQIANCIANGIDANSILAITFTNKAASETRHRVVKNVGEIGWQVVASTYHSFCRKWILKPNEHHDFFKALGYNNGFIILDDSDSLNAMREVKGRLTTGQALMLEVFGLNERSIINEISSFRADGISLEQRRNVLKNSPTLINDYMRIVNRYSKIPLDKKSDSYDTYLQEVRIDIQTNQALFDALICDIWGKYAKECSQTDGLDFDDQILYAKMLLEHDPSIAKRLCKKFTHIFLDEHQDVNQCQWDVIRSIVSQTASPNLFIVGDDRQSIYLFRKAKVQIMMDIDKIYPSCVTNHLVKNYRSTQSIIELGNAHAASMANQIGMGQLKSAYNKTGSAVTYARFNDGRAEARWVINQIKTLVDAGEDPKQIAILYRAHSLKEDTVDELNKNNLDYSIVGDLDFYQTAEVKSVIAALRVTIRDRDIFALSKVLDYATVGITPARIKAKHHEIGGLPLDIIKGIIQTDKRAAAKGAEFLQDLETLIEKRKKVISLPEFLKITLTDHALQTLYKTDITAQTRVNNIYIEYQSKSMKSFTEGISNFWNKYFYPNFKKDAEKIANKRSVDDENVVDEILSKRQRNVEIVLERISEDLTSEDGKSLVDCIDEIVMRADNQSTEEISSIQLMTNHASKGLEFDHVFIIGAENEAYLKENATQEEVEEESRNFYVAITRAAKSMYISSASSRYIHGNTFKREELDFLTELKPLMNLAQTNSFGSFQQNNHQYQRYQQNAIIDSLDLNDYMASHNNGF